jgi:hypothetical protein
VSSTRIFFNFLSEAFVEMRANFYKYALMFFVLVILSNLEEAYKFFGGQDGDGGSIVIGLLAIVFTFIISAKIILMHKKNVMADDKVIYILVPFLLYSFYYSLLFFFGLIFLIIPGLWVLIYLSQAPLVAALAHDKPSFFKHSIFLVKKNVKLVAWISITSVLLEFFLLLLAPIADQKIRWALTAILSVPDAFLTIALTTASVRVFYYLEEL